MSGWCQNDVIALARALMQDLKWLFKVKVSNRFLGEGKLLLFVPCTSAREGCPASIVRACHLRRIPTASLYGQAQATFNHRFRKPLDSTGCSIGIMLRAREDAGRVEWSAEAGFYAFEIA